jgi:hypothetical protein
VPHVVFPQAQAVLDRVDDRSPAGVQHPVPDVGEVEPVARQQPRHRLADVDPDHLGQLPVEVETPFSGAVVPVETHRRPPLGHAKTLKIDEIRVSAGRPGDEDRGRGAVTEEAVDYPRAHGLVAQIHRGVNLAADQHRDFPGMRRGPLGQRVEPVQAGVAAHSDDVGPHQAAAKKQLPGKE